MSLNYQRGNVLFLILIAVALFAALSYAVTKSTSGGGSGADSEKANLIASELLQYASSLSVAINRMKMINGCDISQISFENSEIAGYNFSTSDSCKVFHADGGGLTHKGFDAVLESSGVVVYSNGNNLAGTSTADLILLIIDLPLAVCKAINSGLGAPTLSSGMPVIETGSQHSMKYTGTFSSAWTYTTTTSAVLPNSFCIQQQCYSPSPCAPGRYYYSLVHQLHEN